jgi:thiamine biosynthesis lipoprotein
MPKLIQPRVYVPGRTLRVVLVVVLLLVWAGVRERRQRSQVVWTQTGEAFGSTYTVKVFPAPPPGDREDIAKGLEAVLQEVDAAVSTYRDDSELARFNENATTNAVPVGPVLGRVLVVAQEVARASGGAFDITCGPLLDVWRFDDPAPGLKTPDEVRLAEARERSGHARLHFDGKNLSKEHPRMKLNVNAIAPGMAADLLREWLAGRGMTNVYVEVGGETLATGSKARGAPWRVGIQRPSLDAPVGGRPERIVELRDRALATSGDYRNYRRDPAGHVVSHIFDPRQGRPLVSDWASVSVLAPTCAEADAWATALFVLGPEEGLALLPRKAPRIEAMFLVRAGEGFKVMQTPGFTAVEPEE